MSEYLPVKSNAGRASLQVRKLCTPSLSLALPRVIELVLGTGRRGRSPAGAWRVRWSYLPDDL